MRYVELPKEQARKICKKYKANCDKCPLRREDKGKTRFCYYVLYEILQDVEEECEKLKEEEIKYWNEELRKLTEIKE